MGATKNTEEMILDCLQGLARDAYSDALEGKANRLEARSADDIIRAFEEEAGKAAPDFLICFAELALKINHEASAKGRARRDALNK